MTCYDLLIKSTEQIHGFIYLSLHSKPPMRCRDGLFLPIPCVGETLQINHSKDLNKYYRQPQRREKKTPITQRQ